MRWFPILFLSAVLSGCGGWQAIHAPHQEVQTPDARLGQISVSSVYSVIGQNMYNALLDRLAKFYRTKSERQYTLNFSLSITSNSQTSFSDGSASVLLRRYTVNYILSHGNQKQSFNSMTTTTILNDNSPFNNAELSKKADEQAVEVLADTMIRQISAFLRRFPNW